MKLKNLPWRDLWDLAFFLTLFALFFLCLYSMARAKTEMDCIRLGVLTILMWLMLTGDARQHLNRMREELWETRFQSAREQLARLEQHVMDIKYRDTL